MGGGIRRRLVEGMGGEVELDLVCLSTFDMKRNLQLKKAVLRFPISPLWL